MVSSLTGLGARMVSRRFLLLALSAGLAAPVVAEPAPSTRGEVRKHKASRKIDRDAERRRLQEELNDQPRADTMDPSGDLKAYPNWARAALGSRGPIR